MNDRLETAAMIAERLRPIVLASCDQGDTGSSCLKGTPMIPLHRATVTAILQHLDEVAEPCHDLSDFIFRWFNERDPDEMQACLAAFDGRDPAQAMSAGTAETAQQAQGQSPASAVRRMRPMTPLFPDRPGNDAIERQIAEWMRIEAEIAEAHLAMIRDVRALLENEQ